ncbi:hydantoinase B/oxoprolinase family protein [Halorientalis pallida]|uniref:Hydantoinase B/oxoprolinase family protein n=1 Tax=Halorientalis pallida TaxID=2479928 RepID=A0A498KY91_9EURY|nr:hydantoinase B/oxoprolinase family protein [Halorientalis pallida]RXK47912.1 hydantoinase B/oxoprolinase family protein [Halorientalis pallida]
MTDSHTTTTVRDQTSALTDVDDPESAIDPVKQRVIGGSLVNVCDEMGHKLTRMSYSSIIRESEDFGCALLDERARQIAETDSTPLQMGPIPAYVSGVIELFEERGETFAEGDVILHNDPYYGASHAPDFAVVVPVFHDDDLTAFSVTTAHHLDVGADKPGTCIIDTVDAYSESVRLDALKIIESGTRNDTAWQLIEDNIRVPDMVMGDIEAQISAAQAGANRLQDLFDEFGHDTVKLAGQATMSYSERMLREEISELPDGTYSAEGYIDGYLDSDDESERDLLLAVDLEVDGSDIRVDLSRCAAQVDGRPINMPFEGTVVPAVLLVIRSTLLDTEEFELVPQNHGITRPVHVHAPEGSIVNPRFPAPTIARFGPGNRLADLTLKALADVVPEKTAAGIGNLKICTYSGVTDDDEYWVYMDITSGSYGARPTSDGLDATDTLYANTRNNPIEDIESHYPLRVNRYELREDAEGAGRQRGGIGAIREMEFQTPGRVSIEGEGSKYAPWGFDGGEDGTPGAVVVEDEIDESTPRSKMSNKEMDEGQYLRTVGPCGGGWGDPEERDPEAVRQDVLDDLISRERAERVYGVIVTDDLEVDEEATAERRR